MAKKFLGGIDVVNNRITSLADPSASTDAVNLQYLQAFVRGLTWKPAVRAASTANVSLSAPGATLDGVTLVSGDRVLLKNQTAGAENGIYVWTGASAALTRATDFDSSAEALGATVLVTEGTANGDKMWTQNTDSVTLGTTSLTFVQLGGGGSTYTAGNGLSLTTGAFAVVAGSGIIADATSTRIDSTVVVRKYAVAIGNGALTAIPVAHNLGTRDITFTIYNATTFEVVETDAVITDVNTLTLSFASAPTAGQYRVVVHA